MATTGVESFKHDYNALPKDVLKAIRPIYKDLSDDILLERCVGGHTQNNNESLNQLIWWIAPKKLSESFFLVEIAANVAACTFNEGNYVLLNFLHEMGIELEPSAHHRVELADNARIERAEKEAAAESKEARIHRCQQKQ